MAAGSGAKHTMQVRGPGISGHGKQCAVRTPRQMSTKNKSILSTAVELEGLAAIGRQRKNTHLPISKDAGHSKQGTHP